MAMPIREAVLTDRPSPVRVPFTIDKNSNGKALAIAPKGCAVSVAKIKVVTAMSAGAALTIGTAASPALLLDAATSAVTAAGVKQNTNLLETFAVDTEIIATLTGAPTVGAIRGFIEFGLEDDKAY